VSKYMQPNVEHVDLAYDECDENDSGKCHKSKASSASARPRRSAAAAARTKRLGGGCAGGVASSGGGGGLDAAGKAAAAAAALENDPRAGGHTRGSTCSGCLRTAGRARGPPGAGSGGGGGGGPCMAMATACQCWDSCAANAAARLAAPAARNNASAEAPACQGTPWGNRSTKCGAPNPTSTQS
jgi:hypothetical protein